MEIEFAQLPSGLVVRVHSRGHGRAVVTPAYKTDRMTVSEQALVPCADPHRLSNRQVFGFFAVTLLAIAFGVQLGFEMYRHHMEILTVALVPMIASMAVWGWTLKTFNLTHN